MIKALAFWTLMIATAIGVVLGLFYRDKPPEARTIWPGDHGPYYDQLFKR